DVSGKSSFRKPYQDWFSGCKSTPQNLPVNKGGVICNKRKNKSLKPRLCKQSTPVNEVMRFSRIWRVVSMTPYKISLGKKQTFVKPRKKDIRETRKTRKTLKVEVVSFLCFPSSSR
ncbi:MAG TPA: hypothetical protein DCZ55_32640, partial [Cyanobacteria bacterium UBA11371]|nr:hypothetical protein [Cyanobacteria bacterium UBA11371]